MERYKSNIFADSIFCYKSKKFYVLTLPKIASSWMHELFTQNTSLRDVPTDKTDLNDFNRLMINQLNLKVNHEYDGDFVAHDTTEFSKDWESLLNGNKIEKDFIFLMRNPIDKFIVGVMQDFLFKDFFVDSPIISDLLTKYENKEELKEFYDFHNKEFSETGNAEWWHSPPIKFSTEVYNVLSYLIKCILEKWMSDVKNIPDYRTGHKNTALFLYYKILFNSNIDKNKIKIIDIDKENIFNYLNEKYDLKLNVEFKQKFNLNHPLIKIMAKNCMIEYRDIINEILATDILLYCDLYNHLYSENLTPEILWDNTFKI